MRVGNCQKGFSLIELLAVVAVIGILSVIGIPQYQRFNARARQTEAKVHLVKIYQGEIAFFTEHNTYTGNMAAIGAGALGVKLRYDAGFRDGQTCAGETTKSPATADDNNNIRMVSSPATATWYYEAAGISDTGNVNIVCSGAAFQAGAWGNPTNRVSGASNNSDLFSIDEQKVVRHLNVGL